MTENKNAKTPTDGGTGFNYFRASATTVLRQTLVDANDTSQERVDEKAKREQEPVAWISEGGDVSRSKRYMDEMGFKCNPLYTEPKQWVGLTDEERSYYLQSASNVGWWQAAKMIEAKLKEKNT